MAALCPEASLETLRPLCYRGTQRLQEDLCRCFREVSLQEVQVVVALSASRVLQNSPQFIVQGVEVWTPRGPILGADKSRNLPRSHSWVVLALWAGAEFCWKTHFWPLKTVVLRGFTTPCNTPSWYTRAAIFTPFSQNEEVSPLIGHPPPNHDVGRVMASCTHRTNLKGVLSIDLVALVVIQFLSVENFLVREEDVFVPVLGVPLEETFCSCTSGFLQSRSKEVSVWAEVRSHV